MKYLKLTILLFALTASAFAAFTERYVSVAGGGAHDGTTEADAWTLAEMITAAPAANTRVNIISGSYSTGAITWLGGTLLQPVVYRGYQTTIGDLDSTARASDGSLDATGFPVITVTAATVPAAYAVWQNISFTGAISGSIIGSGTLDSIRIEHCKIVNTQNNAAAACVTIDDNSTFINSDFSCTGAAHGALVNPDANAMAIGCRFQGVDADTMYVPGFGTVAQCVFVGNGTNKGLDFGNSSGLMVLTGNTFYNLTTSVELPNAVLSFPVIITNNMVTDCGKWLDSLYVATANAPVVEYNTRIRDVTTPRTGIEGVSIGEVSTDTGGAETDYVNSGVGNLRLISASPAVATGMINYSDIGGFQIQSTGGGGQTSAVY